MILSKNAKKSFRDGKRKEINGFLCARHRIPGQWNFTSEYDDMQKHIDCIWSVGSHKATFDIKASKKHNQWDDKSDYDIQWIEFMNVGGRLGWLYGASDYIMFERENEWVCVKRLDIINLISEKTGLQAKLYTDVKELGEDISNIIKSGKVRPGKGFYELHRRDDRLDYSMKIEFSMLEPVIHNRISKLDKTEWDKVVAERSIDEIKDDLVKIYATRQINDVVIGFMNSFFSQKKDDEIRNIYKSEVVDCIEYFSELANL